MNPMLDADLLLALAAFAFVSSITPGPNNLMLMASGANFGVRRTIPHMLGVALGFVLMVALVGIGLVGVFEAYPVSYTLLKVVSVAYLLWLAWRIANSAPPEPARTAKTAKTAKTVETVETVETSEGGRPMTFVEAALFQWVNPKAWAMALTAVTVYAPSRSLGAILLVACVFGAVNLPSVGSWAVLGRQMRRVLTNRTRLRVFNAAMALLLVASLLPVVWT